MALEDSSDLDRVTAVLVNADFSQSGFDLYSANDWEWTKDDQTITAGISTELSAADLALKGNTVKQPLAGGVSANATCSAPAAPTLTDTDPDSPASDDSPKVRGTLGAGDPTQVRLYEDASCGGRAAATGTVSELTGAGITVSVSGDRTTQLSARAFDEAENASACSNSLAYAEDSTRPRLALSGKTVKRLGQAVSVRASCNEACTATGNGRLVVPKAAAASPAAATKFALEPATARLRAGGHGTLKLKVSEKARKAAESALEQGAKVTATVTVTAADAADNARSGRRTVRFTG